MEVRMSVSTTSKFPTKCATCPAHLICFDIVVLIMFYILCNLSLIVYNYCNDTYRPA